MINTEKLSNHPEDLEFMWPSPFNHEQAHVFLHRNALNQPPTGYLSAPHTTGATPQKIKIRIVRDDNEVPEGSQYLGSYSDSYMGPAFHALHVFLLP